METYFENVRLLLPTLGINVFTTDVAVGAAVIDAAEVNLELRWEDARAECAVRNGQFVVREGSLARVREVESLGDGSRALRKNLKEAGVLVAARDNPNLLRFAQEYAFDSPSAAAAVVSGTGLNGRTAWRVKGGGVTYKEWQEAQVDHADDGEQE